MLTAEAKRLLAETIRGTAQTPEKGIRARLLRAIHDEADRQYRLSVPIAEAGLDETHQRQRERIEAWLDERARATDPKNKTERKATTERLLAQAEKEAAATFVNRLVLLRHLEALSLSKPAVLTGGWSSKAYPEFREFAPTLCTNGTADATEGYATLLQFVFDELAVDLPGLFGDVGLTRLFQIPAAMLREVIERLDEPDLNCAWTDDTTLGWVYQYWNDPDREALDAKINGGGKIEPHEIASKTQMFTERYMVDWLLQNSLGLKPSVEFQCPGRSPWNYAQFWAHQAVDRPEAAPLPDYNPVFDEPTSESLLSYAFGIALGRFDPDGEGIVDGNARRGIPNGILFLSVNESSEEPLGVWNEACRELRQAWNERAVAVGGLNKYLRTQFFDFHKKLYENRPIYFPLSSAKRSFVAFVSIHRWADDTLNVLLADHLVPAKRRLDGELNDLRTARATGNDKGKAEKRFSDVQKLLEELNDFIAKVTQIAEQGPPPPDYKTTPREVNARYAMDLDDGVMVNSAALWPLLEPHWKDPKKWWKELADAQGKKDYDWSHLAARYFPTRARQKCHVDPSLAVAHHCFWELHPAKAYTWELRLQDEIRPDFTIDEPASGEARAKFLAEHATEAREILAKELKRRERKSAKANDEGDAADSGPLFDDAHDRNEVAADA